MGRPATGRAVITLRGIDAVLDWYAAGEPAMREPRRISVDAESLDVSEERGELEDFGEGRVRSLNRLIYTSRGVA